MMSSRCRYNWCFVVIVLLFMLCGHSCAFPDYNEAFCKYTVDVLRISNSTPEEAKKCMTRYANATQLLYTESNLVEIPSYINILKNLKHLDLSKNSISDAIFSKLDSKMCSNLMTVNLNFNNIIVLKRGHLDCLRSVGYFYIMNNSLSIIENGTFSEKLSKLRHIHVGFNKLTQLDSSLFAQVKLHENMKVRVNATWNDISMITNSYNLTIYDVSNTTSIGLVLVHNNFTTINTKYLFKIFNVTDTTTLWIYLGNSGFDLRFNPFICDCSLYKLAIFLRIFHPKDPDNPVFSITCGHPQSLNGKLVREVNLNDFNCSVAEQCPSGCTCILTINLDLITVHCSRNYDKIELPLYCPKATELSIDMNTNNLERLSRREYMRNVTTLDVSGCGISVIDSAIIPQLERMSSIYVHDNKLAYIPKSFQTLNFSHGQILTLYGNPFVCDCHTIWMKKWLLMSNKNVAHEDKTFCATGPGRGVAIVNVPDSEFVCTTQLSVYVIVAIATGSVVFLILVSVTVNHYKTHAQVWLISNFDVCKYCCRNRTTNECTYDIFVPHSCEDDDDVIKIVDSLEKISPPYKVCLGERDFSAGKTITENILFAVKSSHTTLLIVSNNFLRSSWCDMEFREAHTRFLRDRDINLILVVLEELDKTLINPELKSYMDTHVYINYKDKRFLARLLVNLPVMINQEITETSPLITKSPTNNDKTC